VGVVYLRRAVPVRVKICGTTRVQDAVAAIHSGADALGFMFFEGSKRHVSFEGAAEIIRELPPFVAKVGVFVNPVADFVRKAMETGIDTLQFHGEESPEFCLQFGLKTIKAFRVRDRESLREGAAYRECAWLLDSHVDGAQGGTGVTFDWNVAVEAVKVSRMVILAGGLKPESVGEAVRKVRPYAVDVSSGVESEPGKKDHAKVRDFIAAAKSVA
jgi:phosphoribosylanthranilate isomerase